MSREKSKPVVRAEHIKLVKAARAKLDKARAVQAAAEAHFNQAIRNAYADGVQGGAICEAGGIDKDRAYRIRRST